jgi:hypothetical protein
VGIVQVAEKVGGAAEGARSPSTGAFSEEKNVGDGRLELGAGANAVMLASL